MSKSETTQAIAARLRKARQGKDMSQPELARALGMSKQSISAWEKGRAQLYAHQAAACAKVLDVDLDWLLLGAGGGTSVPYRGAARPPRTSIDKVSELSTGQSLLTSVVPDVTSGLELSASTFALAISNASMAPVLARGDMVLVDPEQQARQGDLVAAAITDGNEPTSATSTVVRQISFLLHMAAPPFVLAPASPKWPLARIEREADGRILGVVVAVIRRLRSPTQMDAFENHRSVASGRAS